MGIVWLAWWVVAQAPAPAAGGEIPSQELLSLLEIERARWSVPGAGLVVVREGRIEVIPAGTLGLGSAAPIRPETPFPAGSCTKAFTTALLALEVAAKRCQWDDSVHRHLDWFPLAYPDHETSPIRLWHLGSHSSGMLAHDLLFYRRDEPGRNLVEALLKQEPKWQPGSHYQYQNLMVRTLGMVAEATQGQPWETQVSHRLLNPLGISGASFDRAGWLRQTGRPSPHRPDPQGKTIAFDDAWFPQRADPCSSLALALRDWGLWLRFHLDGAPSFDAAQLREVKATHERRMVQPSEIQDRELAPEIDKLGYGLGWVTMEYRGEKALAHGGVMDGYRSFILLLPDRRLGVAVFANLDRTPLCHAVACQAIDRLTGRTAVDWSDKWRRKQEREEREKKETEWQIELAAAQWAHRPWPNEYFGVYRNGGYGVLEIEEVEGKVLLKTMGREFVLKRVDRNLGFVIDPLLGLASVRIYADKRGRMVVVGGRLEATFHKEKGN